MKSQLNNALAFFQVVAIITNLSTFVDAKIRNKIEMAKKSSRTSFPSGRPVGWVESWVTILRRRRCLSNGVSRKAFVGWAQFRVWLGRCRVLPDCR